MFGGYFEGLIMNRYGSYDVHVSACKYIHYDLTHECGFKMITLTIGSNFVTTFLLRMNVGSFIHIQNFGITFKNRFEHKDWGFVLRVGASTTIDQIHPFFYHTTVGSHTFHTWICGETKIGRIGHNRGCGH
jgi:hypothetical protein